MNETLSDLLYAIEAENAVIAGAKSKITQYESSLKKMLAEDIASSYQEKGDKFGTVTFEKCGVQFKVTTPKTVNWDQDKLAAIYDRIKRSNDNPLDYLDLSFSVSETKYKAWPEVIRSEFTDARTVKEGKQKIEVLK